MKFRGNPHTNSYKNNIMEKVEKLTTSQLLESADEISEYSQVTNEDTNPNIKLNKKFHSTEQRLPSIDKQNSDLSIQDLDIDDDSEYIASDFDGIDELNTIESIIPDHIPLTSSIITETDNCVRRRISNTTSTQLDHNTVKKHSKKIPIIIIVISTIITMIFYLFMKIYLYEIKRKIIL